MIQHHSPISGIAAFSDKYVATAGYDNQVILWNQRNGEPLRRILHDHLANQCQFSRDGTLLVTSSSDYTARLWSVPDMRLRAVLNDHDDDVEMSTFHPTLEYVATASRDHIVRAYDFSGKLVRKFVGHSADVISVEWSHSGDELISSSDDGTIKRWSLESGDLVADIDLGGAETDTVAISTDGTIYAGNDEGELIVLTSNGQRTVKAHAAGIKRLVLGQQHGLLVSLSYDRSMHLWDVTSPEPTWLNSAEIPDDVWPRSCAFGANSTLVFATFGATYRTYDYESRQWDSTGAPPTPGVNAVGLHDGRRLTVGDSGRVREEDRQLADVGSLCNFLISTGGLVLAGGQLGKVFDALFARNLYQHKSPLNCAAKFWKDGIEHVVIGSYTGEGLVFRFDEPGRLEHVGDLSLHDNAIKGVAVSGDLIFSVCADHSAAWHRVSTFEHLRTKADAHGMIADDCVALGDGWFASVGRDLKLRVWSPEFDVRVLETPHEHSHKCVAASPDGRRIAIGAYDGVVGIYDRDDDSWPTVTRPTAAGISDIIYDGVNRNFLASSYDGNVYQVEQRASSSAA
ncbi:WD40 repeat protein [Actinopolyspora biskrensis]|uniref:WD40 repeat protein n=1 Tax=Actinopolyspora biskrensis TaxID=1470178 RepID=A0A852YUX5_9ACTN|nr:WD40 repeat domain-containing protein [Actinopolyspora biskrensis]NYH77369.1 WD40 repeat protein [Actinopolyspora biskrensis]